MRRELNHSSVSLPSIPALKRKHACVEVWNDTPDAGEPPHVVLTIEINSMEAIDLLPSEARAVAALLIAAAETQGDRS